jgi:hypothetical protein
MILSTKIKVGLSLLFTPAIFTAFYPGKIAIVTAVCLLPICYFFIVEKKIISAKNEFDNKDVISLFYFICIITFIRGIIDIKSQQDFIVMFSNNIFIFLLYPLFIYLAQRKYLVLVLKATISVALPLSLVTYFYIPSDAFMSFQHNISFIYLFVFFIPFVKLKWKVIIVVLSILSILYDFTRRSSFINISICFSILLLFYFLPYRLLFRAFRIGFYLLGVSPVILLILGLTGVFNVLKLGKNLNFFFKKKKKNFKNFFF